MQTSVLAVTSLFIGASYAWALILWGLHKVDYPFLRPVELFAPWGFILASVLFMTGGFGILFLYYERSRDRLQREIKERQKSETRFRNVIESSRDAIILADATGAVLSANKGALLMFGYLDREMVGLPLIRLMPEQYRHDHLAGMSRVLAFQASEYLGKANEFSGLRKDGTEFPLELNVSHWKNEDGAFLIRKILDG